MLELELLGTPVITRDGEPLTFDTRKAVAMLAMLAIEPHAHSRERVAAMLWPDADDERARATLRRTLSVAVTAVGAALTADRTSIRLVEGQYRCDVDRFRALAASREINDLRAAAALYHDDFLAGFGLRDAPDFDDWQHFTGQTLRQELSAVLRQLIDAHIALGDLDRAVVEARRLLALDELHEPAHQTLIKLHAWAGDRTAAIQQYRTCVRLLDRELGVPPLQETRQLAELVRTGELRGPPQPAPRQAAQPVGVRSRSVGSDRPPLFGRGEQVRRLRDAVASWERGDAGRVVEVTGPLGIGKTRLLAEVSAIVAAAGREVIAARCHEAERGLTYSLAVELLRAASRSRPDLVQRLPEPTRTELSRLVPDLGQHTSTPASAPPQLDGPGAVVRLYAAVADALVAIGPLAIVIDDVHLVDVASAELLAYLLNRVAELNLLVVLSYPAHVGAPAVVRAALESRDVVALPPFTHDDVREVLTAAGIEADDDHVRRLLRETGGIPLLVLGYARDVAARDVAADGAAPAMPADVRNVFVARLTSMSETGQQVLGAAAVLGGPSTFDELRATSGRADVEVVDAIEEASSAGLLVEARDTTPATYDLPYAMLQRVVDEQLSAGRRRLLHGRAAEALLRRKSTQHPTTGAATIARHLHEAGRFDEAAEWHWRAALDAQALFAHAQALEQVEEAQALGFPAATAHLLAGELLTTIGRYREALAAYEAASAATSADDTAKLAAIEHRLADVYHRIGDYRVADAHASAALALLDQLAEPDGATAARVMADQALIAYRLDDDQLAAVRATRARAAAEAVGDPAALAQALDVEGMLALRAGNLPDAEAVLQQSLVVARQVTDPSYVVAALNNLARVQADRGNPDEALATASEALALGLAHGDRHRAAALHTNLADLLHACGRDDDAIGHLKEAAALFAGIDNEAQLQPEIWKLVQW